MPTNEENLEELLIHMELNMQTNKTRNFTCSLSRITLLFLLYAITFNVSPTEGAQEGKGNGVLLNTEDFTVTIQYGPIGSAELIEYKMRPKEKLDLKDFDKYTIKILGGPEKYDINTSRELPSHYGKHIFSIRMNGIRESERKLIIQPRVDFSYVKELWFNAEKAFESIKKEWTVEKNGTVNTIAIELNTEILLELFSREIRDRIGVEVCFLYSPLGRSVFGGLRPMLDDGWIINLASTEISDEKNYDLLKDIEEVLKFNTGISKLKIIKLSEDDIGYCTLEDIEKTIRDTETRSLMIKPKFDPWKAEPRLPRLIELDGGLFPGIDGTKNDLDEIASCLYRRDYMKSQFPKFKRWIPSINQCLRLRVFLFHQLSGDKKETDEINELLEIRYAIIHVCGILEKNISENDEGWPNDQNIKLDIDARSVFFVRDYSVRSGRLVLDDAFTATRLPKEPPSVEVRYEDIDQLHVRGFGWRLVEKSSGKKFEESWQYAPRGKDTYRWNSGRYEVRVRGGSQNLGFNDYFEPFATGVTKSRVWSFSQKGWNEP